MEYQIGDIANYYGGLSIKEEDDKYFWGIENYSGIEWKEIPKYVFQCLLHYEQDRKESQ